MAPRTDRTTPVGCRVRYPIPSDVASPVTTNHAAKGSVFVNLRNAGNLKIGPNQVLDIVSAFQSYGEYSYGKVCTPQPKPCTPKPQSSTLNLEP